LPDEVANQIAAGEVVERPASVLKELVENALDAGARRVQIDVEAAGRGLIRVADDGHGMSADDLLLAVERHATSKLGQAGDLIGVRTLGFRGEALPSIASVSRLRITTRQAADEVGALLVIEGGVIRQSGQIGCRVGSTVEARDLFFNIPARRKFLRGQITEAGHLSAALTRLALGWPGVAFRYAVGGKALHDLPATADLTGRVAGLLGREAAAHMVGLDQRVGPIRLWGLAATPAHSRSAADQVFVFVNGRFVRDKILLHAVGQAYHGLLPAERRPVAVLHLELDPELVDVNVHPAKIEVRFRQQREVHDALVLALRRGLAQAAPARGVAPAFGGDASAPTPPAVEKAAWTPASQEAPPPANTPAWSPAPRVPPAEPPPPWRPWLDDPPAPQPWAGPTPRLAPLFGPAGELSLIGQLHGLYILCAAPDGLVIIDQHAAHERLTFERLKGQLARGAVASQGLLAPVVLELSPQEAAWAALQAPIWARLGLEIAPFGGNAWAVRSLPALAAGADPGRLARDMLSTMSASGMPVDTPEFLEAALISLACHGSIRQGQQLSRPEMDELVRACAQLPPPVTCPHGRPVFLSLGRRELARCFKRGSEPRS